MNTQTPVRAISVCIFDPSGRDTGKTFPEGSVWMLDRERAARRRAAKSSPSDRQKQVSILKDLQTPIVQKLTSTATGTAASGQVTP